MDEEEQKALTNWLLVSGPDYLRTTAPGRVDDAEKSKAVRLRWFNVKIGKGTYLVGMNIHYGGDFGALWIKNTKTNETMEFHPHAPPQHGLKKDLIVDLKKVMGTRTDSVGLVHKI